VFDKRSYIVPLSIDTAVVFGTFSPPIFAHA